MSFSQDLLLDGRGSSGVQMLVLTCCLALGGIAGIRALKTGIEARADCAAQEIRSLGVGGPCAQEGGFLPPPVAIPPLPPTEPRPDRPDSRPEARPERENRDDPDDGDDRQDRDGDSDDDDGGGGGLFGTLGDIADDIGGIPGGVLDRGREVLGGLGDRVDQARDRAEDVIDVLNDVPGAIERGRERLIDDLLDDHLHLSERVRGLEPGDSMTIALGGEFSAGVAGDGSGTIEVTRTRDGRFVVEASASLQVGVGIGVFDVLGGGTGSAEFTFAADEAGEVLEAVQGLVKLPTSFGLLGIATRPAGHELRTLEDHVSAVELDASALGKVDFLFGLNDVQARGAEGQVGIDRGARIEFEDGRASAIVGTVDVTVEGAVEIGEPGGFASEAARRIAERFGLDASDVEGRLEAGGSLAVEVRRPIRESPGRGSVPEQIGGILLHPTELELGPTQTSIHGGLELEVEGRGAELGFDVVDVGDQDLGAILERASRGDLDGALAAAGGEVTGTFHTFEDRGLDEELDVNAAAVSIENSVREAGPPHTVSIRPNADGTGLDVHLEGPDDPEATGG